MRHSGEVDVLTDVSGLLVHQSELIIIEVEQEVLGLGDERGTDQLTLMHQESGDVRE